MQTNVDILEGFFVVTDDNHIFEVKGDAHPEDRVIAYLRYVPSDDGDRFSSSGVRYKKVYSLQEREKYLADRHPEYLWYDQRRGRVMQTVPMSRIAFVLNPVAFLNQIRDMGVHLDRLQRASLRLARMFVDKAGLSWANIGITGSQLAGLSIDSSDIDLIVYGSSSARRLYTLLKSRGELLGIKRYTGTRLDKHVAFRWGQNNAWREALKSIEAKKVLQGEFETYDFYVRNVKVPQERVYSYEDLKFFNEGIRTIRAKVTDNQDCIFTPCTYDVECKEDSNLRVIMSYRGRFTEQAEQGMLIEARGRAERVRVSSTGEEFTQMVLGEEADHYMVPDGSVSSSPQ